MHRTGALMVFLLAQSLLLLLLATAGAQAGSSSASGIQVVQVLPEPHVECGRFTLEVLYPIRASLWLVVEGTAPAIPTYTFVQYPFAAPCSRISSSPPSGPPP